MIYLAYDAEVDWFVPTKERPDEATEAVLQATMSERLAGATKHRPGDGWHYVPGETGICFSGEHWFVIVPDSTNAIYAHLLDLCDAWHWDFHDLQCEAFPNEEPLYRVDTYRHRRACARRAAMEDTAAVIADLVDINLHALAEIVAVRAGLREKPDMNAHYLVLQVPNWHAEPNHSALVRVYEDDSDVVWFGTALDNAAIRTAYPSNAIVLADYVIIADSDVVAQEQAEISAIRSFYPPTIDVVPEEGWLSPEGRYYAVYHSEESHEELARRICAVRFGQLLDSADLEKHHWLRITAGADFLADTIPTQPQRDTLFDLSRVGDYRWRGFMSGIISVLPDDTRDLDF